MRQEVLAFVWHWARCLCSWTVSIRRRLLFVLADFVLADMPGTRTRSLAALLQTKASSTSTAQFEIDALGPWN
jgi:hypothetical protein